MDTELIRKYLNDSTTDSENRAILEWLEQSEENRKLFSLASASGAFDSMLESETLEDDTESMLCRLNARIDAEEKQKRFRRNISTAVHWTITATACLGLLLTLFFHSDMTGVSKEPELRSSYSNGTSSVKQIVLPDNTKVYLTPGSSIRYDVNTLKDKRLASLEGEAYFDIAKDTLRPFTVNTEDVKIRVTGTAFSVKTGLGSHTTEVVLERGGVKLMSLDNVGLVNIRPNQKVTVDSATSEVSVEEIYAIPYITEKYNLVSMLNATLEQIVGNIENLYGVEVKFTDPHPETRYDINFLKSDQLKDVMEIVQILSGTSLSIESGI